MSLFWAFVTQVKRVVIDGEVKAFTFENGKIGFEECVIKDSVEIVYEYEEGNYGD